MNSKPKIKRAADNLIVISLMHSIPPLFGGGLLVVKVNHTEQLALLAEGARCQWLRTNSWSDLPDMDWTVDFAVGNSNRKKHAA